jgi:hypothetical protein
MPFAIANVSFPVRQFWQDDIENWQNGTVNLCEQYQPISRTILGLMASIFDQ